MKQHPPNSQHDSFDGLDGPARRERVIERMLHERLGGDTPPDLSRRILANLGRPLAREAAPGTVHVMPKTYHAQRLYWAAAAAIAVLSLVGFAVATFYLGSDLANRDSTGIAEGNQRKATPAPKLQPQTPAPEAPKPDVRPAPAPKSDVIPEKQPDHVNKPQPEPELPPKPEIEPKPAPGPTVEDPKPEVETPIPTPTPDEPLPSGPTVETPPPATPGETPGENPTKPEHSPTEVPKAAVVSVGKVVNMADRAQLTFRRAVTEKWQDWAAETSVDTGMMLKARKPVTVQLTDGSRLHFDGEIALAGTATTIEVSIETESVYFEGYSSKSDVTLRRGDASVSFRDAEVVAERSGARLVVTCLGGEVTSGEATLQGGFQASLTGRGFGREKRLGTKLRSHALVESIDKGISLHRDELDGDSGAKFECSKLENGLAIGKGKDAFCILPGRELLFSEGAYVRMRVRVRNSQGFSIGAGTGEDAGNRYFQHHVNLVANDKWVIVKVSLAQLMDETKDLPEPPKDKPKVPKSPKEGQRDAGKDSPDGKDMRNGFKGKHLWPGAKLMFMKIVMWNENAELDVDWIEWGIEPEWARK